MWSKSGQETMVRHLLTSPNFSWKAFGWQSWCIYRTYKTLPFGFPWGLAGRAGQGSLALGAMWGALRDRPFNVAKSMNDMPKEIHHVIPCMEKPLTMSLFPGSNFDSCLQQLCTHFFFICTNFSLFGWETCYSLFWLVCLPITLTPTYGSLLSGQWWLPTCRGLPKSLPPCLPPMVQKKHTFAIAGQPSLKPQRPTRTRVNCWGPLELTCRGHRLLDWTDAKDKAGSCGCEVLWW